MRVFILLIILVTLQNIAKADGTITVIRQDFNDTVLTVNDIRGGHPIVMKQLWNEEISLAQAVAMQNCINQSSIDKCIK